MISPNEITDFNRSNDQLEEFILFCVVVAGKKSIVQAKKLESWYEAGRNRFNTKSGFKMIRLYLDEDSLRASLEAVRMGQYTRICNSFRNLSESNLNLQTCTIKQLEKIKGIGPKTSRFFALHSRPEQKVAVLDTHILSWLRAQGYAAPKATPQSLKKYGELETAFLNEAAQRGLSLADMDLEIWRERSNANT